MSWVYLPPTPHTSPCPSPHATVRRQRMGVLEVAFALKLTQGNRVGLAAPGKSPLPSRADDVRAATAEQ